MAPPEPGEPDYRFTLANERTFLAWIRTALALIAGGIALKVVAPELDPSWPVVTVAVASTGLGAVLAVLGYRHWRRVQRAMATDAPLPGQIAAPLLTAGVVLVSLILLIAVL